MEVNPVAIASCFKTLVQNEFPNFPDSGATELESLFSKKLLSRFFTMLTEAIYEVDDELEESAPTQVSSFSEELVVDESGSEVKLELSGKVPVEKKLEILRLIEKHPTWSLTTIQRNGGKEFKHKNYKTKWQAQVKTGGTKYEKFKHIDKVTFEKFQEARQGFMSVKDHHLQLWAIQASQSFRDPNFLFKASPTWVINFKQRHGISSRKVTKLVSKNYIRSKDEFMKNAEIFQKEIKSLAGSFPTKLILNTDQAGSTYEIANNRTLSFKGEKITLGVSKSPTGLATHSYTVQYVINMAGDIVGDVFLCLQEKYGKLGPIVQENLPAVPNVTLTCSKSGKLTTSLFEYFLDRVIIPNVKQNFVLAVDTWSGQTNVTSYQNRFGRNGAPDCNLKLIPKNCTSMCQPLDTTFHRQLKYLARRIYEEFFLFHSTDINPADELTTRNNIIIMQSLMHNQLSAGIFKPMIKYCWYSSGLTDERVTFLSVKEVCFTFDKQTSIKCEQDCNSNRFIKCAHCKKSLCFMCFFNSYHFHF